LFIYKQLMLKYLQMNEDYLQHKRSALPLVVEIESLLRARGIMSAAEIIAATGKSQQLVSIALRSLGKQVAKLGAARATRYALTKPILGLPATQPLLKTDEAGQTFDWGTLTQLNGGQVHVRSSAGPSWLVTSNTLPWFLAPLRPEGFLARALRGLRPDLPDDPTLWTVEQALYPAIMHHSDPPGAFSIGTHIGHIRTLAASGFEIRGSHYDTMADTVGKTLPAHSSAGGEQPKFVTEYTSPSGALTHYVVKFSPPNGTPFGERWRALLHLEHLANEVLGEQGIAVAKTNIVESAVRTYLESERFDRMGNRGKRHVVALDAIDRTFVDARRENWIKSAELLLATKLITAHELQDIARVFAFGQFIGNTDMHFGNLSFYVDDVVKPRIRLAPIYDMLPMMWRPGIHTGELDATPVREQPTVSGYNAAYADAQRWAIDYWRRAASLPQLGSALRQACAESAARLASRSQ
jgi:hypothetical protein